MIYSFAARYTNLISRMSEIFQSNVPIMTSITAVLPVFFDKNQHPCFKYLLWAACHVPNTSLWTYTSEATAVSWLAWRIVLEYFCEAFCRVSFSCSFFYHLLHEDEEGLLHIVLFKQLLNFGSKLRSRPNMEFVAKVIDDICVKYFWIQVKLSWITAKTYLNCEICRIQARVFTKQVDWVCVWIDNCTKTEN